MREEYRAKILELWQIQEQLMVQEVEAARRRLQVLAEELRKRTSEQQ